MRIAIASGKGGTGKTTLAVNLAVALRRAGNAPGPVSLLDCDVEEPNAHLFVQPRFDREDEVTALKPTWDEGKCTDCGRCADVCAYNALAAVKGRVMIFPELCHACGACSYVCPEGALPEHPTVLGKVQAGRACDGLLFAHGVLTIAETLAPLVVRAVKARAGDGGTTILDAPPGTACPVVEALIGADVALLVTEPTPFGLHDLKLAARLAAQLRVPMGVVVNRSDGADAATEAFCRQTGIPLVGRIPFRRAYAETYSRGDLLVDGHPELTDILLGIYERACALAARPPEVSLPEEPEPAAGPPPSPKAAPAPRCQVAVISGKGGTGKTTVAASLAALMDDKVLADSDVDAPDLHLLLAPRVQAAEEFVAGSEAIIDLELCTACGLCAELCRFDAIEEADGAFRVGDMACEGCGLCALACPAEAIRMETRVTGLCYWSATDHGAFAHAQLGVAEENSGRLVSRVREMAAGLAAAEGASTVLADGPPGTGCPVIASLTGADLALLVTEPTVSGVHDLERVLALARHMGVSSAVCINKVDLNPDQAERIRKLAREAGAPVLAEVPFDDEVGRMLAQGLILAEAGRGPAARAVRSLADRLFELIAPMTAVSAE